MKLSPETAVALAGTEGTEKDELLRLTHALLAKRPRRDLNRQPVVAETCGDDFQAIAAKW
jgi:hypothetical protein